MRTLANVNRDLRIWSNFRMWLRSARGLHPLMYEMHIRTWQNAVSALQRERRVIMSRHPQYAATVSSARTVEYSPTRSTATSRRRNNRR